MDNFLVYFAESLFEAINRYFSWGGWTAISAIVLAVTIIYIEKQASATRQMVEFQCAPRVVVGMASVQPQALHDAQKERLFGTSFRFYNYTDTVVWVWKKLEIRINGKKITKNIDKIFGEDLLGKNPLMVLPVSPSSCFPTAPYDFLLETIRENNIIDVEKKKITAELKYWSTYNSRKQKNLTIFGPISYYFDLKKRRMGSWWWNGPAFR